MWRTISVIFHSNAGHREEGLSVAALPDNRIRFALFEAKFAKCPLCEKILPMIREAAKRVVLLEGQNIELLSPYKPWPTRGILVSLGPRDGASALPVLRNG